MVEAWWYGEIYMREEKQINNLAQHPFVKDMIVDALFCKTSEIMEGGWGKHQLIVQPHDNWNFCKQLD